MCACPCAHGRILTESAARLDEQQQLPGAVLERGVAEWHCVHAGVWWFWKSVWGLTRRLVEHAERAVGFDVQSY